METLRRPFEDQIQQRFFINHQGEYLVVNQYGMGIVFFGKAQMSPYNRDTDLVESRDLSLGAVCDDLLARIMNR